jgi:PPOX class probable FMN-dependent enzyme
MDELNTPEAVRGHYEAPHPLVLRKQLDRLDRHCRAFIAASPFYVIASSDAQGRLDATPRGDRPGAVAVVDDATVLLPDRRGNNRLDTMMNVAENPHVGLLFLVPGVVETLRVNGRAGITIDPVLLAQLGAGGRPARAAIRVEVEEVYFQCGKALIRSELWNPERRAPQGALAPLGQVLAEQIGIGDASGLEASIQADYRGGLY